MGRSISISDYFEDIRVVFDPSFTFEGNYAFLSDIFYETSKKEKGVNLAKKYFEDNYIKELINIFNGLRFNNEFRLFLFSDLNNGYGRNLKVSISLLVMDICNGIIGNGFIPSEDIEELKKETSEFSRKYRKIIAEILKGNNNPENAEAYAKLKKFYDMREAERVRRHGRNYIFQSFPEYLERVKNMLVSLSFGVKSIDRIANKEVDLIRLSECLDLDKFFLAMAKQLIEVSKYSVEQDGSIHNSFIFVDNYVALVKKLKEQGYKEKVTFTLVNGNVVTVNVDDVIREYNEMRLQNPSYCVSIIPDDNEEDLRDIVTAKKFSNRLQELIDSRELKASWEFVKNGHLDDKDKKEREKSSDRTIVREIKERRTREELVQDTNDRIAFLDSSPYLYRMNGKNNFEGYVGYIYPNGYVIFEKFYQHVGQFEPATNHATYVMSFTNFVEMSKRSKTEIMNYIKNGEHDLKRIYHTKMWYDRVEQVIQGRTYNQEAIDRIERLIADEVVTKIKR